MISLKIAEVFEADETGKAAIGHGYTYSGHPVGAAVALACLAETKRLNVPENAAARGQQVYEGCLHLQEKYELIGDVQGRTRADDSDGTCIGPRDQGPGGEIRAAGASGNDISEWGHGPGLGPNVILSPALIISEAEINTVLTALDKGLAAASQA